VVLGTLVVALWGCDGDRPELDPTTGLLGQGLSWPFPSAHLVEDGHLAIPSSELALPAGSTPLPTERLAWRTGFSPVQTAAVQLEGVDAAALPGADQVGTPGSVRLVDLDTGTELPMFAELDAHPDAVADGDPTLLVRPLKAMPVGHRVAVVVLDDAAPRPDAFQDVVDAEGAWPDHYRELLADLDGLGLGFGAEDIALAWDFPIGDGTRTLRGMLADLPVPEAWRFDTVLDVDAGSDIAPGIWKRLEGSFTGTDFLVDDLELDLDEDGVASTTGAVEVELFVYLPETVRHAEPGTVPVLVFGHGLLADPNKFLDDDGDAHGVIALLNDLGAIAVATTWRGLTTDDRLHGIEVAGDFGRFNELTERAAQGVVNALSLVSFVQDGELLADPLLEGLPDRDAVSWYGISLGGTLGAVVQANSDRIDRAVYHVGGAAWSMMLERSSAWVTFEPILALAIEEPEDRQHLYALSQLFWDPVDSSGYAGDLSGRSDLLQMAVGDDTVTNLATELLLRSTGWPLFQPASYLPAAVGVTDMPGVGPGATQFDPLLEHPPEENRPAENVGSHTEPRTWESVRYQTLRFLRSGEIVHPCGQQACTAENQDL